MLYANECPFSNRSDICYLAFSLFCRWVKEYEDGAKEKKAAKVKANLIATDGGAGGDGGDGGDGGSRQVGAARKRDLRVDTCLRKSQVHATVVEEKERGKEGGGTTAADLCETKAAPLTALDNAAVGAVYRLHRPVTVEWADAERHIVTG
jgi:hypothetical protein